MVKIAWSDFPWWLKTLVILQFVYFILMLLFSAVGLLIGFAEGLFLM